MSLESIVKVTISASARGVSKKSFGVIMVAGYHTAWLERYRVYTLGTALADLVSDGIPATSPIYRAVKSAASNTPKSDKIVVGRLVSKFEHKGTFTVVTGSVETGKVYSLTVTSPGGDDTVVSYTALAGDTETIVAAALASALNGISDLTSTNTAAVVSWEADNAGEAWMFAGMDINLLEYKDTTTDSSLVTELGQITTLYPDYYGLILADAPSAARITAIAAATETQERIFGALTHDSDNTDSGSSTCIAAVLKAASHFRTFCFYSEDQKSHGAACWMGGRFPIAPGASTWAYKPLSGTIVDTLTTNQLTGLDAHNANYYVELAGTPCTIDGKMAAGEWIDVIRGRDWLVARLRERQAYLLLNKPKIPFTDGGVKLITAQVQAQLEEGVGADYLSPDPEPFVTAPKVADVSAVNKTARVLPDVYFEATLAGAIHEMIINGVLKV